VTLNYHFKIGLKPILNTKAESASELRPHAKFKFNKSVFETSLDVFKYAALLKL